MPLFVSSVMSLFVSSVTFLCLRGVSPGSVFPIVLLDEASQMTEPSSLLTIARSVPWGNASV